jgi:Kdo2-lipid IVA lauroyltransferase/acyltransferase
LERAVGGWRRLGFVVEAVIVIPLGMLVSLLPLSLVGILGRMAGSLLFHMARKQKLLACRNLDIVFADHPLSRNEKDRIVRKLFINLACSAFEYLKVGVLRADNYEQFVRLENPRTSEELDHVLSRGKGMLAISAHIGNWEYLASVCSKAGKNMAAVINRQHNPYTDRWLKNIREQDGGVRCYYNETGGLLRIVKHLRQNGVVALLADEAAPSGAVQAPFFGRETATTPGPARLHLKYGAPLMCYFCVRQVDGKYLLTSDGPYHVEPTGEFDRDCRTVMTLINQKYEAVIRKYPDQWYSLLYPKWNQQESDH